MYGAYKLQVRQQIIGLAQQGYTSWAIHKLLPHLDKRFIERWMVRDSPKTLKGRGRKPFINLKRMKSIYKSIKKQRFKSANRVRNLVRNPTTGKIVSASTMARYMHLAGGRAARMRKSFYLSDLHQQKRMKWASEHENDTFEGVVWTDESTIEMMGIRSCDYIWHDKDEQDCQERYINVPKHQTKIMVWGGISRTGRTTLHFHDKSVNSTTYKECLSDAFLPAIDDPEYLNHPAGQPGHLQQDGASCHMSKTTVSWLQRKLPKGWTFDSRGDWPPNSPDLNPIENVWAILKDKVYEKQPKNETELAEVIEEAWWAIPQSFICRLIDSMPERIRRVKNANGGRFKKVV